MSSNDYSSAKCYQSARTLQTVNNLIVEAREFITPDVIGQLYNSCKKEEETESSDMFGKPMVWIGIYIAIASLLCIFAMAADLLHGIRNKKFWFPCKYFSLNAASITVIAVAMKLPVDLSSGMLSYEDQAAKLGSLGFMCIMMANIMPSLASMDNKTLLANIIGLCILVVTMIVNICIQINTGAIHNGIIHDQVYYKSYGYNFVAVAHIYPPILFLLLIMMISSSLTIPSTKEILESKYQATSQISLTDQHLQHLQMSKVEKLKQHLRRYWVMAETGSPQFVMASTPLSTAFGVISVTVMVLNLLMLLNIVYQFYHNKIALIGFDNLGQSTYKWSTGAIFIAQSIGVVVGTIAPVSRCFSVFSFNLDTKWIRNYIMFFRVEKYWTQKLLDWKQTSVLSLSSHRRLRSLIYNSKNIILDLCIGFQKAIVISCKMIWLIVMVVSIFLHSCFCRWKSLKARWFSPSSRTDDIDEDLSNYVLQIDDEIEFAEKTLERISVSMNSFISKAQKEQNINLLELLDKSNGFEGVQIFETDHVQPLLPVELVNNWSLPIVTLTCIAVAIQNYPKHTIENLFKSVSEGLSYTHLVEESINSASEYVKIQKTAMLLWHEAEHKCKWLDYPLAKDVFLGKTTIEVIRWFSDKAKQIVTEFNESTTDRKVMENPPHKLIAANSMYRITQTILLRYQSNIEPITKSELFAHLNGMIADIFSACFTNIPRVITMRCHESVIEKRESSVKVAAKLLGNTTKIIERLETLEIPRMDDDKMAYIDEWRLYLKQSIP